MVWHRETSQGSETSKTRERLLPYLFGKGLDLGCGSDKISKSALGVDWFTGPGVDFFADIRSLPFFETESFDFVYSSHALEDIEDTEKTLREWWRLVKRAGYLILYLPDKLLYPNIGQPGGNPAHKHDFVSGDIISIMAKIGNYMLKHDKIYSCTNEYSFLLVFQKLS